MKPMRISLAARRINNGAGLVVFDLLEGGA